MNIEELLKYGIKELNSNNIEDATLKAKLLLIFLLGQPKEYLLIHNKELVNENIIKEYEKNIKKLKEYVPLQYITKKQEFMKMSFLVNENVLIPRADTEVLVEEVIKLSKNGDKILDVCTGSGAIAVSLAKYIKNSKVTAIDISEEALKVAQKNAKNNKVDIDFIQSNMLEKINSKYNIIVSNPPYIQTSEIHKLDDEVRKEPIIALDGGQDGLKFYKILVDNAYKYLEKDGYLCLEIGYNQKDAVEKLLNEGSNYKNIYSKKDLAGNDRIVITQRR